VNLIVPLAALLLGKAPLMDKELVVTEVAERPMYVCEYNGEDNAEEGPTLTVPLALAWILPTRVTVYCPAGTVDIPVSARDTVLPTTVGVANAPPNMNAGVSASMSAPEEKEMTSGVGIGARAENWTCTFPHDPEAQPLDTVTL